MEIGRNRPGILGVKPWLSRTLQKSMSTSGFLTTMGRVATSRCKRVEKDICVSYFPPFFDPCHWIQPCHWGQQWWPLCSANLWKHFILFYLDVFNYFGQKLYLIIKKISPCCWHNYGSCFIVKTYFNLLFVFWFFVGYTLNFQFRLIDLRPKFN